MSGADWDLISELLQFPNSSAEILAEHRQRAAPHDTVDSAPVAATVMHAKPSAPSRKRTAAVAKPTAIGDSQAIPHVASAPVAVAPADPVTLLLQALDNATDDAERERLLQAAPYEVRTALDSYLTYHALIDDCAREVEAQDKRHTAFTAALDACSTDESRVALIHAAQPSFLAEWSWRQSATDDSWVKRYLAIIGADKGN